MPTWRRRGRWAAQALLLTAAMQPMARRCTSASTCSASMCMRLPPTWSLTLQTGGCPLLQPLQPQRGSLNHCRAASARCKISAQRPAVYAPAWWPPPPLLSAARPALPCSVFRGREASQRINTTWGSHSLVAAVRLMLRDALADLLNQRFILLSGVLSGCGSRGLWPCFCEGCTGGRLAGSACKERAWLPAVQSASPTAPLPPCFCPCRERRAAVARRPALPASAGGAGVAGARLRAAQ